MANEDLLATAKSLAAQYLYSGDKEIWRQHVVFFHFFPILCTLMSVITTPAGKTSIVRSLFNIPGKLAWMTMELVSPMSFLLSFLLNKPISDVSAIPYRNLILAGCFLTHYTHRAIISPLRAPNISPNHLIVWIIGVLFNYTNGYSLGGLLLLQFEDINTSEATFWSGVALWAAGLYANVWHENVLYAIRRRTMQMKKEAGEEKKNDDKQRKDVGKVGEGADGRLRVTAENGQVYEVPEGGLYAWSWHPHYFVEWIEWTGFLIATGGAAPAVNFLVNEVACMAPRALQGKYWYKGKFGKKTPNRAAVVPFIL